MRTTREVGAEIMDERERFLAAELADDKPAADRHERRMNAALEEYGRIPHPRLPSDEPVHPR